MIDLRVAMETLTETNAYNELMDFLSEPNALRSMLILAAAILAAYLVSKYLALIIIKVAQKVAVRTDAETNEQKHIRLRQVETYLSISVAVVRVVVVIILAYITWSALSPISSSGVAAIGASAFFIVFAGQTLGMLLRDVTAGATMIIEGWFHVGDYIKIEPLLDVSGVVERFTLRSTKLRSLNGEVQWIHNQYIQSVHVTPNGLRTIAVDVFVKDLDKGENTLKQLIHTVPTGSMMLVKPLKIASKEEWPDKTWRLTVVGQTPPGREWLIEQYFVNAIKHVDEHAKKSADKIFLYEPIARYADPVAEKKFRRAIRTSKT